MYVYCMHAYGRYKSPCGYWELNLGSLQEQKAFLATEPSFQLLFFLFETGFLSLGFCFSLPPARITGRWYHACLYLLFIDNNIPFLLLIKLKIAGNHGVPWPNYLERHVSQVFQVFTVTFSTLRKNKHNLSSSDLLDLGH